MIVVRTASGWEREAPLCQHGLVRWLALWLAGTELNQDLYGRF